MVPFEILPWFVVFQLLAVLMFSSLFMAIGASVNQLKEAQSLLLPVWILIVLPLFVWLNIVREPTGSFATWFSLIPPFIPMLMCLRMSATSAIPLWQPILGLVLMLVTTALCVFAASRVFRIGMLTQGRAPEVGRAVAVGELTRLRDGRGIASCSGRITDRCRAATAGQLRAPCRDPRRCRRRWA